MHRPLGYIMLSIKPRNFGLALLNKWPWCPLPRGYRDNTYGLAKNSSKLPDTSDIPAIQWLPNSSLDFKMCNKGVLTGIHFNLIFESFLTHAMRTISHNPSEGFNPKSIIKSKRLTFI